MVQDEKQKKLSKPEPDGLKPKEIQWKKKLQSEKQKKNPSNPEPDGLQPKAIKW